LGGDLRFTWRAGERHGGDCESHQSDGAMRHGEPPGASRLPSRCWAPSSRAATIITGRASIGQCVDEVAVGALHSRLKLRRTGTAQSAGEPPASRSTTLCQRGDVRSSTYGVETAGRGLR
jgi:hypothetical protein